VTVHFVAWVVVIFTVAFWLLVMVWLTGSTLTVGAAETKEKLTKKKTQKYK
jgi:hypothetical protein